MATAEQRLPTRVGMATEGENMARQLTNCKCRPELRLMTAAYRWLWGIVGYKVFVVARTTSIADSEIRSRVKLLTEVCSGIAGRSGPTDGSVMTKGEMGAGFGLQTKLFSQIRLV